MVTYQRQCQRVGQLEARLKTMTELIGDSDPVVPEEDSLFSSFPVHDGPDYDTPLSYNAS